MTAQIAFCTRECYNGFNVHDRVEVRMKYLVPDRVYNILKWVGLIAIPAVAALVGTVGTAVGWDATGVAVTIITGVGTFIGALLGVSNATGKPEDADEDQ